jgi:hypothetical protein
MQVVPPAEDPNVPDRYQTQRRDQQVMCDCREALRPAFTTEKTADLAFGMRHAELHAGSGGSTRSLLLTSNTQPKWAEVML